MPQEIQPKRIPPNTPFFVWPTPDRRDLIIWQERSADLPANMGWKYGDPYPDPKYPDHVLIHVSQEDEQKNFRWYWMAPRKDEDEWNWSFSKADIGGTNFDSVERTYVVLRDDFNPQVPAMGTLMNNQPEGKFIGSYVLAKRGEVPADKELNSLFVVEKREYVKKVPLIQNDYDEMFGENLHSTQTLYYATEIVTDSDANQDSDSDSSTNPSPMTAADLFADGDNGYWGLQDNGTMREGKQVTAEWYLITERQVVPTEFALHGRSFQSTVDYSWPGVLERVSEDIWPRRKGGTETYPSPVFSKEAYQGPCKAQVIQRFYAHAPAVDQPNVMRPMPIIVQNPFFALHVGPTLHPEWVFTSTSGSNHPIYKLVESVYTFHATTPTDWPGSILYSDTLHPFRGGFLRVTTTVYPPAYTST